MSINVVSMKDKKKFKKTRFDKFLTKFLVKFFPFSESLKLDTYTVWLVVLAFR